MRLARHPSFQLLCAAFLALFIPHGDLIEAPDLCAPLLFFWALFGAEAVPLSIILIIGVFEDASLYQPLGLHSFVYLLTWGLLLTQRRFLYQKPFLLLWFVFACVFFGIMVAKIVIVKFMALEPLLYGPELTRFILTVCIYPLETWLVAHGLAKAKKA